MENNEIHDANDKQKHLEFIQNIITRMNTNSFQLKGLSITLIAAAMAIYASTGKIGFIFLGIPPSILFWFLDAFYLQQERKFRGLYKDAAGLGDKVIRRYDMPIHEYTGDKYSFIKVLFSKTIFWFYFSIILFLSLLGGVMLLKQFIVICFKCPC